MAKHKFFSSEDTAMTRETTINALVAELDRAEGIIQTVSQFAALHGMHYTSEGSFDCHQLFSDVKAALLSAPAAPGEEKDYGAGLRGKIAVRSDADNT